MTDKIRVKRPKPPRVIYIREWRELRGMTQDQLADLLEMNRSQISNWESGARRPLFANQIALAKALGVSPQDLFRHPNDLSLDDLLRGAHPDVKRQAFGIVKALLENKI